MDVFDLCAKISLDSSEYESGLSSASSKTATLASSIGSGISTAVKVGTAALAAATTAVVAFGAASVKTGEEFDSSMSQVAATMGTTVDQIQDLRDFALEMGSTTAFSATEAAEALNYMALAGYDAETSMEMLPTVLNLAAAGSMELATASDMVTDAQTALGLTLDETTTMVDQMAAASSKSNTSVEQLGEAFLSIGGTAKDLAGGTTELSTVLGVLADNGIKGAEGGTHLRNIMLALESPTDTAAAALSDLGVEVFDAEGNMRSMTDILGDMNDAMGDLTSEEKTNIISTIFNKTDIASVNALLDTSTERWDELTASIEDSTGAAEAMADTQLDNLAGDITLFQSALEGAQIAISDKITPTLREFVQFGSNAISTLSEAFQEGGLSGAMDALGTILSDGLAMVIEYLPDVVNAGMELLTSLVSGIVENIPTLMDAAGQIVSTLVSSLGESLPRLLESGGEAIGTVVSGIQESLPDVLAAGLEIMTNILDGFASGFPDLLANGLEMLDGFIGTILDALPDFLDAGFEFIGSMIDGLVENTPSIINSLVSIINSLVTTIVNNLPTFLAKGAQLIVKMAAGILQSLPTILSGIASILANLISAIGNKAGEFLSKGVELIGKLASGLIQAIPTAVAAIPQLISKIISKFTSTDWGSVGKNIISGIAKGITNGVSSIVSAAKEAASSALNAAKSFLGIKSPSRVFRDQVGAMVAEGMAVGIEQNADSAISSAVELADRVTTAAEAGLSDLDYGVAETGAVGAYSTATASGVAASGNTTINITVNGAKYSDDKALAEAISYELQRLSSRKAAAYA